MPYGLPLSNVNKSRKFVFLHNCIKGHAKSRALYCQDECHLYYSGSAINNHYHTFWPKDKIKLTYCPIKDLAKLEIKSHNQEADT